MHTSSTKIVVVQMWLSVTALVFALSGALASEVCDDPAEIGDPLYFRECVQIAGTLNVEGPQSSEALSILPRFQSIYILTIQNVNWTAINNDTFQSLTEIGRLTVQNNSQLTSVSLKFAFQS